MADRVDMLASEIANLRINLRGVRQRLERLEQHLGIEEAATTPGAQGESAIPAPVMTPPEPAMPQPAAQSARGTREQALRSLTERSTPPSNTTTTATSGVAREKWSWERVIGGRAFGIAGSLIVVIGAALFLKLAYDEGWLGRIPPMWRCIIAAGFGVGLIGVGETLRKRLGALASTGVTSAGLATVYAAVYAAHGMFGLVSDAAGLWMLVGVTGAGILLGAVGRRATLAVLSLVGAYVSPLVIGGEAPSPIFFPGYLFALLCFGLVLGGWLGSGYRGLRSVAWWGTVLLGSTWIASTGINEVPIWALVFIGAVWLAVQAEMQVSARFMPASPAREDETFGFVRDEDGSIGLRLSRAFSTRSMWLVSCFGTTLWALGAALVVVSREWGEGEYLAPIALGVVTMGLGLLAWMHGRGTGEGAGMSPGVQIGSALFVQTAGLLVASVGLGLSEWMQVATWLGLGVASAAAGKHVRCAALRGFGVIVLGIATMRLVTIDLVEQINSTAPPLLDVAGVIVTKWSVQVFALGVAWLLAGLTMRRIEIARTCGVIGLAAIAGAIIGPGSEVASVAVAWSGLAIGAWGLSRATDRLALAHSGGVVAFGAGCAWIVEYARLSEWTASTSAPVLHPGLAILAPVVLAQMWLARALWADRLRTGLAPLLLVSAIALALMATSYEVHRVVSELIPDDATARRAAVSVWWAVCGVATLLAGWLARNAPARWVGLGLLGAAALKLVIIDLTTVSTLWRIVGSMAIGLTLLGVAVAYARRATAGDVQSDRSDE